MILSKALRIIPVLFLAACATTPDPRVVTQDVKVEVPVSCVPESLPPRPIFTDTAAALKAAAGVEDRYLLMAGNWFTRDARLTLLEGVVAACRTPAR